MCSSLPRKNIFIPVNSVGDHPTRRGLKVTCKYQPGLKCVFARPQRSVLSAAFFLGISMHENINNLSNDEQE
jgi:hypothetical protein